MIKMVAISFCMKAHGTEEPRRGHLSPDGQYTSGSVPGRDGVDETFACCCLIELREQGKQNLCCSTDGHWTNDVSSSRS